VTHRNTNWPVRSLSTADRTGSPIFSYLWSYVLNKTLNSFIKKLSIVENSREKRKSERRATGGRLEGDISAFFWPN
ncbi:hypothetical protein GQ43DRAFT_295170, partial [Delitschia confertaspora ATCC 74209]